MLEAADVLLCENALAAVAANVTKADALANKADNWWAHITGAPVGSARTDAAATHTLYDALKAKLIDMEDPGSSVSQAEVLAFLDSAGQGGNEALRAQAELLDPVKAAETIASDTAGDVKKLAGWTALLSAPLLLLVLLGFALIYLPRRA